MTSTRPTISGPRHAVSAGHYLAAAAGFAILEAGGNAVDAGCAAGIALGVLQPDRVNFAGVAPIMIRMANGTVETVAGLGHWPRAMPPDVFMREHGEKIPTGVRRTVVPAAPDAWITALERHGTMAFADVSSHAIRYARDGFAVDWLLAEGLASQAAAHARWPQNGKIFLPGGRPPGLGERFVQTDLAATIQFMADQERAAAGRGRAAGLAAAREAFYRGDVAAAIVKLQREEGGWLSSQDLSDFRSRIEPPVRRIWRGHDLVVCGPWCQGPALLETMLLADRLGIADCAHNSADYLHIITESVKIAMADREYHFGDPQFVEVPVDRLLSADHIARRAAQVQMEKAFPAMPSPLDAASVAALPKVEADTSYACVVDRWGNAFSATPSDGASAAPVVPGMGFVPSTRGSQSRPDPRHPSGAAPGKRPRLTPNPAMLLPAGGGVMPFGTPGGDVQIQAMAQVLLNVFQFGMDLQSAIEAPRVASYSFPSSFAPFEYFPGRLAVEGRIDAATRAELSRRGHGVHDWPDWTALAGSVEAVHADPAAGLVSAGADPRRPAYAIAG